VVRVPAYAARRGRTCRGLILALNRRLHRAYNRTREGDFTLHGLTGFDLVGKTVGVVGTGQIGAPSPASWPVSAASCWPTTLPQPELLALGARYLSCPSCCAAASSACTAR
jgi:D-lactate dehydrogenase